MLIQNVSLVCELTNKILWKTTDIQNFCFSRVLSISTFVLIENSTRLFTCKPCRGESDISPQVGFSRRAAPEVLDQEQFACIISRMFLIFLKHNPPINFSKIISC